MGLVSCWCVNWFYKTPAKTTVPQNPPKELDPGSAGVSPAFMPPGRRRSQASPSSLPVGNTVGGLDAERKIPASANDGHLQGLGLSRQSSFRAKSGLDLANRREPGVRNPSLTLLRITRFGRTLELVGKVEAGSRLTVNDDPVEVSGDGLFRHFTKRFPRSIKKAKLVLTATNLAGKSAVIVAPYNFCGRNGNQ
jgi:hypothetical protein